MPAQYVPFLVKSNSIVCPLLFKPSCAAFASTARARSRPHVSSRATTMYDLMPADFASSTSMFPCRATLKASRNMLSSPIRLGASEEGETKRTLSPSSRAFVVALSRTFVSPWLVVGPM